MWHQKVAGWHCATLATSSAWSQVRRFVNTDMYSKLNILFFGSLPAPQNGPATRGRGIHIDIAMAICACTIPG